MHDEDKEEAKPKIVEDIKKEIHAKDGENLKEAVLAEAAKGNVVLLTMEGLARTTLKSLMSQPIDGMLYDLNRNETVILTFLNDSKWVNDYATVQVIRALAQENEELKEKLKTANEVINADIKERRRKVE